MVSRAATELKKALQPKMTGAQLAERLDVSRAAVSGWTKGDYLPTPQMMGEIEKIFGIPMQAWLEESPPEETTESHDQEPKEPAA